MGIAGFVTTLILLALQFIGAMNLHRSLSAYAPVETGILVIGLIVSIIALIGIAVSARWSWPLMLMVFSGSMGNFIWLYSQLGNSLTIGGSMVVTVFSMMIAFVAVDLWEPEEDWDRSEEKSVEAPAKKKPKKKSRKR